MSFIAHCSASNRQNYFQAQSYWRLTDELRPTRARTYPRALLSSYNIAAAALGEHILESTSHRTCDPCGSSGPKSTMETTLMETFGTLEGRLPAFDLADIFERRTQVTPRRELKILVEGIVASVFGIDPALLRRSTRGQARVALARQVAMYIAHVAYGLTLTEVGELFGRDRTTVAHACQVVEQRRDSAEFDESVVLLELIVRALSGVQMLEEPGQR